MSMYFKCILSIADTQNIIIMKNDIVVFLNQDDDGESVNVEGKAGWCNGHELSFTNIEFAKHFEYFSEPFKA